MTASAAKQKRRTPAPHRPNQSGEVLFPSGQHSAVTTRRWFQCRDDKPARRSVSERAAVLARIGTAGERALVPIDPDRLAAAERADDAGGLVAELFQPLDDFGGHAVFKLID